MNDINDALAPIDLRKVDLNQLVAFDVLMQEKNVTRAADKLFVGQSAMSHTLKRLRETLNDKLLINTPSGMKATPRALALEIPIRNLLQQLQFTLRPPEAFDPQNSNHLFKIGSTDYLEYVFLPPLMNRLQKLAPNVGVKLVSIVEGSEDEMLENGVVDIIINLEKETEEQKNIHTKNLLTEKSICLARVNHPELGKRLTLQRYVDLPHLTIGSLYKLNKIVDQVLENEGVSRKVLLDVPNFLSAPMILAETDNIATLPLRIGERFTQGKRLQVLDLPFQLPAYQLNMHWHALNAQDTALQWLISLFEEIAAKLVKT